MTTPTGPDEPAASRESTPPVAPMAPIAPALGSTLSLATFNIHMGVDGWGRPYDVVGQCRALDTDILVMQESWSPDGRRPSTARAGRHRPRLRRGGRGGAGPGQALLRPPPLDPVGPSADPGAQDAPASTASGGSDKGAGPTYLRAGAVGHGPAVADPGHRRGGDPPRPAPPGPGPPGGHQLHRRAGRVGRSPSSGPTCPTSPTDPTPSTGCSGPSCPAADHAAVLAGDMNLWGPPVQLVLPRVAPGRHRADLAGPRPHSQLDHMLITPALSVVDARVADRSRLRPPAGRGHPRPGTDHGTRATGRPGGGGRSVGA